MYIPTQDDVRLLRQKEKTIYTKLEVKNRELKTLEEVSGVATDFSFSINSDSGVRRTANLSVYIKSPKYMAQEYSLFWIDKIIYVEVGYLNNRTQEVHYYPVGYFVITDNGYSYDAGSKMLTLSLVDLMGIFNGTRGGYLTGQKTYVFRYGTHPISWYQSFGENGAPLYCDSNGQVLNLAADASGNAIIAYKRVDGQVVYENGFPAYDTTQALASNGVYYQRGSQQIPMAQNTIRNAIIDIVSYWGKWDKYNVSECWNNGPDYQEPYYIPYDLDFGAGVTVFDILNEISELYPNYEFFFDIDGTFVYQEIPTCIDDSILLDDTLLDGLVISEPFSNSFIEIYNMREVFGKCYETDYFFENCQLVGNTYTANVAVTEFDYQGGKYYGFTVPRTNPENAMLQVTNASGTTLTAFPIVSSKTKDGVSYPLEAGVMEAGKSYVVKAYSKGRSQMEFIFQGQYQIWAIDSIWSEEPDEATKIALRKETDGWQCANYTYSIFPENPFCVDKVGLKIAPTIEDKAIFTDKLCRDRAQFENYNSTILKDSVSMTMVTIPWLDVNKKIEHSLYIKDEPVTEQYIIKSITNNVLEGTMNVNMVYFYDYYPYYETH